MLKKKLILCLIFLSLNHIWARDKSYQTLPLPKQSMYASKGLYSGMGYGKTSKSGCNSLNQWEGRAGYAYTDKIDGGMGFQFLGGTLDSTATMAVSRYSVYARYHLHARIISFYMGPIVSFEGTDLNQIAGQVEDWSTSPNVVEENGSYCQDNYGRGGVGAGWEFGMGWQYWKHLTFILSETIEFTSVGRFYISINTGLAWDLRAHWEAMQKRSNSFYLYLEGGINLNAIGSRNASSVDKMLIFGAALGL